METIPLHRVAVVRPFTQFLARVGTPFERGFRQAGLPVHALENVDNFISSHCFWKFLINMSMREDIRDLGFRVGEAFGASCADPHLSDLLRQSPTLFQGLLKASAMINQTVSHCRVGLMQPLRSEYTYFFTAPAVTRTTR